jgi:mRNA interferase YafQ
MLLIKTTNIFEKDVRKLVKRGKSLSKLEEVIKLLAQEKQLLSKYRDHKLTGNYLGFKECHIEPDWLLIYRILNKTLYLARTGSHSDLF